MSDLLCGLRGDDVIRSAAVSAYTMVANEQNRTSNSNANNTSVSDFNTYEEYLDSQITPLDMFYLEVN